MLHFSELLPMNNSQQLDNTLNQLLEEISAPTPTNQALLPTNTELLGSLGNFSYPQDVNNTLNATGLLNELIQPSANESATNINVFNDTISNTSSGKSHTKW